MPSPSRNDSPTDLTIPRPPVSSGTEHHHIPTPRHRDRPVSPVPTVRARADSGDIAEATSSDDEAPMPTLTGALTGDPSISASALPQRTPLSLASWFSGQDDSYAIPHPSSTSACRKLQKAPTSPSKPGKSRFAFFSAAKASIPTSLPPSDDLLTIDVARCLAPDACSTDLHTTALRLLTRYQCAYRRQDAALSALQGSEAALREEAEEAEVRNRHLKKQLEEMARRVEEQEGTLRSLLGELVAERRMREEKARGKRCSKVSEDLGVGEREGRRWSGSSEGEGEDGESVFSRCGSLESEGGKVGGRDGGVVRYVCVNCEGADEREPWGVVRGLRGENEVLRGRVEGLEGAVEEVLGMVGEGGLWRGRG